MMRFILIALLALSTATGVAATEVEVIASGSFGRHLNRGERFEIRFERAFRDAREAPRLSQEIDRTRISRLLRSQFPNTQWLLEDIIPEPEDFTLLNIAQRLAERHTPSSVARLELEIKKVRQPLSPLAVWQGRTLMTGKVREYDADGTLLREKTVRTYAPFLNVRTLPYHGDEYIVPSPVLAPGVAVSVADWTLRALRLMYPDAGVPRLWVGKIPPGLTEFVSAPGVRTRTDGRR